jgi:hypothetical protein
LISKEPLEVLTTYAEPASAPVGVSTVNAIYDSGVTDVFVTVTVFVSFATKKFATKDPNWFLCAQERPIEFCAIDFEHTECKVSTPLIDVVVHETPF